MVRERRDKWTVFPMLSGSEKPSEMNVASRRFSVALPWSFVRSQSWRTDQNVKSHTAELPGHFVPNPFIGSSHQGGRLDVLRFSFRVVRRVVRTEPERLRRRDHALARLLRRLPLLLRAFDTVPALTEAARCHVAHRRLERASPYRFDRFGVAPLPAVVGRSDMRRPHFTAPLRKPET